MDVDASLDRLYSVPLDGFTAQRNALSKEASDPNSTRLIKQLKKPSVGAWTINQLVRRHPDDVAELLSVRDELEKADSGAELRELSGRRRELVARLTKLAKTILEDSPHGASHTTLEKISQGLLAGGTDDERDLLEKGRLTREPSASGLDAFVVGAEPDVDEDTAPAVSLKTQREVQRLKREAERLQQESARLEQEAGFAEEQARRAREKAEHAAAAADEAMEKAHEAAESVGLD